MGRMVARLGRHSDYDRQGFRRPQRCVAAARQHLLLLPVLRGRVGVAGHRHVCRQLPQLCQHQWAGRFVVAARVHARAVADERADAPEGRAAHRLLAARLTARLGLCRGVDVARVAHHHLRSRVLLPDVAACGIAYRLPADRARRPAVRRRVLHVWLHICVGIHQLAWRLRGSCHADHDAGARLVRCGSMRAAHLSGVWVRPGDCRGHQLARGHQVGMRGNARAMLRRCVRSRWRRQTAGWRWRRRDSHSRRHCAKGRRRARRRRA
mmetsp:Transcript_11403/g.33847  ORF Transcript_11403/g.33847 Transcript_11403/m.33847 type:complete len:266 (-) Transcript_11403:417-1214(-)